MIGNRRIEGDARYNGSVIAERFRLLRERGERALVVFVTAGDPPIGQLPAILETLETAGADVIEVGIPFSDPIADGPVIQASSQRALDSGVTPHQVLEAVSMARLSVPIVLMGYANPVLRAGWDQFARVAKAAGASATILSDLPPDEAGDWIRASREAGLDNVFLVAPTSTDQRIATACREGSGFVYAVARTGVTGAGEADIAEVKDLVRRVRSCTDLPVCVGFGIDSPARAEAVGQIADGVVVGSWLVNRLAADWRNGAGADDLRRELQEFKKVLRG